MNQDLIYFDHASTSGCKPQTVTEEIKNYLSQVIASPGRGGYELEARAFDLVSSVRDRLAAMLGAEKKEQVVFTHNATHAINIILKGLLRKNDHVIISSFEHNAVYRPIYKLYQEIGVAFDIWQCNELGDFDIEDLKRLIRPKTKLIALNHASNVLGVFSPVIEAGTLARDYKIPFMIDVSQTAGLFPVNFGSIADYIVGTGHKSLLGPPGVGYFYVKNPDTLSTLYEGGSGVNSQSPYHPEKIPDKFEAGTINYLGIAGLKGSLDYISTYSQDLLSQEVMDLTRYAQNLLESVPNIRIYGTRDITRKVPILSFNIEGLFGGETAHFLHQNGICVRGGLHCAPLVHQAIGTFSKGAVRVSFGHSNTKQQIDQLCNLLGDIHV